MQRVRDRHGEHTPQGDSRDIGAPGGELREIIIPHDTVSAPVTAVRNVLIQASLSELKAHGYYEAYTRLIDPECLERLLSSLAPGWIPIELALSHYAACEALQLSEREFAELGQRVGDRVQETVLVSAAKKAPQPGYDLWQGVGVLHRMWPRLFQGGSVQVVKVGPKAQLYEERGFRLNRFHYYRQGHLAAVRATHQALGANLVDVRALDYKPEPSSPARGAARLDELVVRIEWL